MGAKGQVSKGGFGEKPHKERALLFTAPTPDAPWPTASWVEPGGSSLTGDEHGDDTATCQDRSLPLVLGWKPKKTHSLSRQDQEEDGSGNNARH